MPQTHAQRQAAYRQRQADRITASHSRIAALESIAASQAAELTAQAAEIACLKQERERLYAMLETAPSEDTGPRAPDCPHPAHLVDGDRCGGCGQVVDSW